MLQFGAVSTPHGRRLLLDHRAGLEMLRLALAPPTPSPWADVLVALCATLPRLAGRGGATPYAG